MDAIQELSRAENAIHCVDMHTTGEPTRIVVRGYPGLDGTLLEQRAQAKQEFDHIRKKIVEEPRGHRDMYGAVLRPQTEHTDAGKAHMGVLFLTNDGYSTMCGHATIALGRFLVDTHDSNVFPRRKELKFDASTKTVSLMLHAPCGLVNVTVPTTADGSRSDPTRPVSHLSVPSFATGLDVKIDVGPDFAWPELGSRTSATADFAYGGAFYCFIDASELGFSTGLKQPVDIAAMNMATKRLKAAVNANPELRYLFSHPDHDDLGFLYSIIVVDKNVGVSIAGSTKAETGLCFFSDQQIDRSPTGSGVAARVALSCARGIPAKAVTYHSLLSNALSGQGGFIGSLHESLGMQNGYPVVRARVDGFASYTGTSVLVAEESDCLGDDGFLFERL